jgi:hypothetical protein
MVEHRNSAILLPKLDIMAMRELLGVLFGRFLVGAKQHKGPDELPAFTDNVRPILGHGRVATSTSDGTLIQH